MEQIVNFKNNGNTYQFLIKNLSHYPLIKDIGSYYTNLENIDIPISDEIKLNDGIIDFLNTNSLNKLTQCDCYYLFIFIDFLCNNILKQKIIDYYGEHCVKIYKSCKNNPNEMLYSLKLINKIFGHIPHTIMCDIANNAKIISYLIANMDDSDILESIIFLLNFSTKDNIKNLCKKNLCVRKQDDIVYHDRLNKLLDGIILPPRDLKYIVAGGLVNLILDQTLDLDQYPLSDIDIFLYGTQEQQKQTLELILEWIISTYDKDNIYTHRIMSVQTIWINNKKRAIQLIDTNNENPYDIVKNFDLTHLKCWFKNNKFYQTLDCYHTILTKKSYTAAILLKPIRLYKTILRRYKIYYPIDNSNLCDQNFDNITIQKYQLMTKIYQDLLPKSENSKIINVINIATISGYDYQKIYTGNEINVHKILCSKLDQSKEINEYAKRRTVNVRNLSWNMCGLNSNGIKLFVRNKIPYTIFTAGFTNTQYFIHLGKLLVNNIFPNKIFLFIGQNKSLIYQTYLTMLEKIRTDNLVLFDELSDDFFIQSLDKIMPFNRNDIDNHIICSGRKLGRNIEVGNVLDIQITPKFYGFNNKIFGMVTVAISVE